MATNIPPHNLGELIDGLVALIHNPEITDIQLMQYIHGPDFPTGAQILGVTGIKEAYTTGRGSITMRGVANIETITQRNRPEREAIIITELPYQTNKAALIEKIAELVNDKRIEGISDIRDESDRDGMRIVIELKKDVDPKFTLNKLYTSTNLENSFDANLLALVGNKPLVLNLKQIIEEYVKYTYDLDDSSVKLFEKIYKISDIETIKMDYINTAYERMLKSDVKYRFVIDMKSLS
jgi:DNA gyrase subunit A